MVVTRPYEVCRSQRQPYDTEDATDDSSSERSDTSYESVGHSDFVVIKIA